jgi:peptide/nickel transport system permease protein
VARYITSRVLQGIVTALVLLTLVFIFTRISGTPIELVVGSDATPAQRAEAARELGLDQPLLVQYLQYLEGLLHGDLGTSIQYRRPVLELFIERLPNTLRLAAVALAFAVGIGLPLGVLAATRRGTIVDRVCRSVAVFGMSVPQFWLGIMLVFLFSVTLGLLPVAGMRGPPSYLIPAFTLSLTIAAGQMRLVRSSLIEALDSEYIKLARIKGLPRRQVVWKHGFRNTMLPVVTFLGMNIVGLINGSVAVETVFSWPGVGRLMIGGVASQDYPVVQGVVLILGLLVIAMNLLVDILYTYIDPRVRYRKAS